MKDPTPPSVRDTFHLGGMTSADGVARVEAGLVALDGVTSVSVNLKAQEAVVIYDPAQRTPEAIEEALAALGYEAKRKDPVNDDYTIDPALDTTGAAWKRFRLAWALTGPVAVLVLLQRFGIWHPQNGVGLELLLAAPVLAIAGADTFKKGIRTITKKVPNRDALIAIATLAAWSTGLLGLLGVDVENFAAMSALLMALHLTGRYLEARGRNKTSEALRKLLEVETATARVRRKGEVLDLPLGDIRVGDLFIVHPGEEIPTDGIVVKGRGTVDESMVTEEATPSDKAPGDPVMGATVNITATLEIRATRTRGDAFPAQVAKLLGEAEPAKPAIQHFADQMTGLFVPSILGVALLTAVFWLTVPEMMESFSAWAAPWLPWSPADDTSHLSMAIFSAVAVLLIACPGALGLAAPTAIAVGTGLAAQRGFLLRQGEAIQRLKEITILALARTGTLTQGQAKVSEITAVEGVDTKSLLTWVGAVSLFSDHPLSHAVLEKARQDRCDVLPTGDFEAVPGKGLRARVDGAVVLVGKPDFLREEGVALTSIEHTLYRMQREAKTVAAVARGGQAVGVIGMVHTLKPESVRAIKILKRMGIKCVLITGDNQTTAEVVAGQVGIARVIANVLPQDKAKAVENLKRETIGAVGMAGGGPGDATALAAADVSIVVGAENNMAAQGADVTLMPRDLMALVTVIQLGKATYNKIVQNLFWAFGYNLFFVPLAMVGLIHPVLAATCMSLSTLNVIGNSLGLRYFDPGKITKEIMRM